VHLGVSKMWALSGSAVVESNCVCWLFGETVDGVSCMAVYLVPRLVHLVYIPSSEWAGEEVVGAYSVSDL
jgi:hypothetical protein